MKSYQNDLSANFPEQSIIIARLDELCKKNEGNFLWVDAVHFYSNINNQKILFMKPAYGSEDDFSIDAYSTFVSKERVSFFNLDPSINSKMLISQQKLVSAMKENKLDKRECVFPGVDYDNQLLKKEAMNCIEFVCHMLALSIDGNLNINFKNYNYYRSEIIDPIVNAYINTSSLSVNRQYQKGDLLIFTNKRSGFCHIGIFYGYEDNTNDPLICDLFIRDNSDSAKIVNMNKCDKYKSYTVHRVPFDKLYHKIKMRYEAKYENEEWASIQNNMEKIIFPSEENNNILEKFIIEIKKTADENYFFEVLIEKDDIFTESHFREIILFLQKNDLKYFNSYVMDEHDHYQYIALNHFLNTIPDKISIKNQQALNSIVLILYNHYLEGEFFNVNEKFEAAINKIYPLLFFLFNGPSVKHKVYKKGSFAEIIKCLPDEFQIDFIHFFKNKKFKNKEINDILFSLSIQNHLIYFQNILTKFEIKEWIIHDLHCQTIDDIEFNLNKILSDKRVSEFVFSVIAEFENNARTYVQNKKSIIWDTDWKIIFGGQVINNGTETKTVPKHASFQWNEICKAEKGEILYTIAANKITEIGINRANNKPFITTLSQSYYETFLHEEDYKTKFLKFN